MTIRKIWWLVALSFGVVLFLLPWWRGSEPRIYDDSLHRTIALADRIVVRDGGDICCVSADATLQQRIIFDVRGTKEVQEVRDHMRFYPVITRNHCFCCGRPGIDWYRGDERLAITAWKHGYGIMWGGGENLARLTWSSRRWMKRWLQQHGLSESQIR